MAQSEPSHKERNPIQKLLPKRNHPSSPRPSRYCWKLEGFSRKDQEWAHLLPTACKGRGAETELVLPLPSCLVGWGWDCTSPCPMLAPELTAPSSSLSPWPGRTVTSLLPVPLPRRRGGCWGTYSQAAACSGEARNAALSRDVGGCHTFAEGPRETASDPLSARGEKFPPQLHPWGSKDVGKGRLG